jgi:hypothetical protein
MTRSNRVRIACVFVAGLAVGALAASIQILPRAMAQTTRPTLDSLQAQINALSDQLATKQSSLTAGAGISISNGTVSIANGGITGNMFSDYLYINSVLEFGSFSDLYFDENSYVEFYSGSEIVSYANEYHYNTFQPPYFAALDAFNLNATGSLTIPTYNGLPFSGNAGQLVYNTNGNAVWYSIPGNQYYLTSTPH